MRTAGLPAQYSIGALTSIAGTNAPPPAKAVHTAIHIKNNIIITNFTCIYSDGAATIKLI